MPSLADIASIPEIVEIRGFKFEITGLSASHIAKLLDRFPELRAMWTKRDVKPDAWFKVIPSIVPFIIAAGCGKADDPDEIAAAANLGVEDQAALLGPIWNRTMPNGLGPFVERLVALVGQSSTLAIHAPVEPLKAPGTK